MSAKSSDVVTPQVQRNILNDLRVAKYFEKMTFMTAQCDDDNIRNIRGLAFTSHGTYGDGCWIFQLILSEKHPDGAPHVMCEIENPRYQTSHKICLNITAFHNETRSSYSIDAYVLYMTGSLFDKDSMGNGVGFRSFPDEKTVIDICSRSVTNCWGRGHEFERLIETREHDINSLWKYNTALKKCEILTDATPDKIETVKLKCYRITGRFVHHWIRTVYQDEMPILYVTPEVGAERIAANTSITPKASEDKPKAAPKRIIRRVTGKPPVKSAESTPVKSAESTLTESTPADNSAQSPVSDNAPSPANDSSPLNGDSGEESSDSSTSTAKPPPVQTPKPAPKPVFKPAARSTVDPKIVAEEEAKALSTVFFAVSDEENAAKQRKISTLEEKIVAGITVPAKLMELHSFVPPMDSDEVTMYVPEYVLWRFETFWAAAIQ